MPVANYSATIKGSKSQLTANEDQYYVPQFQNYHVKPEN